MGYDVYSGQQFSLATPIDSTTTTVKIAPKTENDTTYNLETSIGVIEVSEEIGGKTKREWIYYTGKSAVDSNGYTPLTGVVRSIPRDGSALTGDGNGQRFSKGSTVKLVAHHLLLNDYASKTESETLSGVKTFTGQVDMDGGFKQPVYANTTARDAFYTSPEEGDECVVTGTGKQTYIGGAWVTTNAAATGFASTTVQGTVEIGAAADNAASTDTGGSGAKVVLPTSLVVKTSSGAADENKIPVLQADGALHINHIATGTPDGTKYVRDDGTLATPSALYYRKAVFSSAADSATLTNPTSGTPYTVHTYTIPANFLTATTWVETEFNCIVTHGAAGTFGSGFRVAGSAVLGNVAPSTFSSTVASFKGKIMGTAAAGPSVAVRYEGTLVEGPSGGTAGLSTAYATTNLATNGTIALDFYAIFGTSHGSNTTMAKMSTVWLCSTTPF